MQNRIRKRFPFSSTFTFPKNSEEDLATAGAYLFPPLTQQLDTEDQGGNKPGYESARGMLFPWESQSDEMMWVSIQQTEYTDNWSSSEWSSKGMKNVKVCVSEKGTNTRTSDVWKCDLHEMNSGRDRITLLAQTENF